MVRRVLAGLVNPFSWHPLLKLQQLLCVPFWCFWIRLPWWLMVITISNSEFFILLYGTDCSDAFYLPKTRMDVPGQVKTAVSTMVTWLTQYCPTIWFVYIEISNQILLRLTYKNKSTMFLKYTFTLTGHICNWEWRSDWPCDLEMHNNSQSDWKVPERQSPCPHPMK